MEVPKSIEIRLSLPGFPELQPLVADFAHHAAVLADIAEPRRDAVRDALLSGVALVEGTLATAGDEGVDLELTARIHPDRLEFSLLESGIPLGGPLPDAMGRDIGARIRPAEIFDRVWWVQRGPLGSELHLAIDRDGTAIHVLEDIRQRSHAASESEPAHDVDPTDETATYSIRAFRPDDGLEVARRIYESYGRSYPNPDLYIPDRILRLNQEGRLHSIVCESPSGDVCGHYALERPDLGAIGEAGQAVIDHRHRGHGLMKPMRAAVEEAGRSLDLLGIWSQPTARHPVSQRMNIGFGSTPCALCLGTTPAAATLRGGVTGEIEDEDRPARHSCFLYWHPLQPEPPLTAFVPAALVDALEPLYAARGRKVDFETRTVDQPSGHETVTSHIDAVRGVAWIAVERITAGTLEAVEATMEAMEGTVRAETVFIDLPIDDPGCVGLADGLLSGGARLAGIGPRFRAVEGHRRAEDVLRLQSNPGRVDIEGLVVEGDVGRALANAVLDTDRWSSSG
ncbi:MAG: hypothetical protein VX726_07680 [Planctomycetota bacterium]|nr:hypothetical protein [Planctomycetota bacterium]